MNFLVFLRRNARPLAFGGIHAFYSAPGQTFVIGLFVTSFSTTLHLSQAAIGTIYLLSTLAASATLIFLGHWIDHVRLAYYSAACIIGLAAACLLVATAHGTATLLLAIYLLRLTGQGLMTHVEATATARTFDTERGRALGITGLGLPLSQFVFPPLVVAGISILGWRSTYALLGAVALLLVLPLTQWLLRGIPRSPRRARLAEGAWRQMLAGLLLLMRSRHVWAILPALAIMPFFGTAIMFHVTTIAADRNWPLGLIATSLPIGAATHVGGLLLSGWIIDRISARSLFAFYPLPILVGVGVLAAFDGQWALPAAFASIGLGGGIAQTTFTAMWAEIFGTEILGTVRSAIVVYIVLMTALAPFVFGTLISMGVGVSAILTGGVFIGVAFMIPPIVTARRTRL